MIYGLAMAEEEGYDKDSAARELDPNRSGVSNQDVGWLARGNSLRSKDKGKFRGVWGCFED